jgi:hypothetical protein
MHHKWPHVLKLIYHLHNEKTILFGDNTDINLVLRYNEEVYTRFLAWFCVNCQYEEGWDITYVEFPSRFISRFIYVKEGKWRYSCKHGYSIGKLEQHPVLEVSYNKWGYNERFRMVVWNTNAKKKKTNDGPTHDNLNHKSQILSNGYFQL